MSGGVLPQQFPRFGMLHRLALKAHPSLFIVLILHGDAVPVAEVTGFGQPAASVVLPLFCRFVVHGAVRQAVRFIVVPLGDEAFILTADKLSGGAVVITLRPAVKTCFLRQPVQQVVSKGGASPVLINKPGDATCRVILHLPLQTAFGGADRVSCRIVLCGLPAAVRVDHGGQVARHTVLIAGFVACGIFLADKSAPFIVSAVLTETLFLMNGSDLPEAVVFIAGLVAGAVGQGQQLPVAAPRHGLFAAGGVFNGRGQFAVRVIIKITGNIAAAGFLLRQTPPLIKRLLTAQAISAGGGDELALVIITEAYTPSIRRDNFRYIPGANIQPVFGFTPGSIRHRHHVARVIKFPRNRTAVGFFFLNHPFQSAFALDVQYLAAVQAVGDNDSIFFIFVPIAQARRIVLLRHPPAGIIAVGGLRAASVLVRGHPSRMLIIVSETAHLRTAAVVHCRQFAARGVRIADQW